MAHTDSQSPAASVDRAEPVDREYASYTAHFAPGPPLFYPGLGMLPGPPTALVPVDGRGPVLLVDDRNAGEELAQGRHRVRLITTAEALSLLVRSMAPPMAPQALAPPAASPGPPDPAPVVGLRQAAALLKVGRSTLSGRMEALAPGQRPANTGSAERPRWWWPSPAACLDWWHAANREAEAPALPPATAPATPGRRREPGAGAKSLVERLAALDAGWES